MTLEIFNKTGDDTEANSTTDANTVVQSLSTQVFFYLFLFSDIPSLSCSLLLFYFFLRLPELRQQYYSHQMSLYLLSVTFLMNAIDMSLILFYLHDNNYFASRNYPFSFCMFWVIYDYTLWSLILWIVALLSLERYLSIFFKQLVTKNMKRRIIVYYIPVLSIGLFLISWYVYLVIFYPCTQAQFDLTQILCGFPCYINEASDILLNFDWIIAALLPVFLTIFFTLILILHVVYQRHKIARHLIGQETWKRTRKMFVQLLPITLTFSLFTMPVTIVGLMGVSNPWYSAIPYPYVSLLSYFLPLFAPFVILFQQKAIQGQLRTLIIPRRFHRTIPVIDFNPSR